MRVLCAKRHHWPYWEIKSEKVSVMFETGVFSLAAMLIDQVKAQLPIGLFITVIDGFKFLQIAAHEVNSLLH